MSASFSLDPLKDRAARLQAWTQTERGRRWTRTAQRLATVLIVLVVAYRLTLVGWGDILQALPTNPLFYLLVVAAYLVLPVAETLIYRRVWGIPPRQSVYPMLKKRVFNQDVLGYSGEAYLFTWAARHVPRSKADIGRSIRDVNILSSAASLVLAAVLAGVLVGAGLLDLRPWISGYEAWRVVAVLLALVFVGALVVTFRRHLFSMVGKTALAVFGLHLGQVVVVNTIILLEWMVALPDVPVTVWLAFLAAYVVMTRIPFLPAQDLVFVGAGVELAGVLDVATAPVAGMLLVAAALTKLLNLLTLAVVTAVGAASDEQRPPVGVDGEPRRGSHP